MLDASGPCLLLHDGGVIILPVQGEPVNHDTAVGNKQKWENVLCATQQLLAHPSSDKDWVERGWGEPRLQSPPGRKAVANFGVIGDIVGDITGKQTNEAEKATKLGRRSADRHVEEHSSAVAHSKMNTSTSGDRERRDQKKNA
jgi:hypothetical protein